MDAHMIYFRKSKTKSHIMFKKYAIALKAPKTSLQIYKNNYFTSCTQKTAIAIATNMEKNILCGIVGRWYKELKVKEFCVFGYIELLFFNGLLQDNYFKKHISQKTKLKYTYLKCLFLQPR